MAEPWSPERVVDVETARALIEVAFPDLAGARLEPMGEGFDNTAYLVGGVWVFRFPRRAIAVPLLEAEMRLLPAIAPRVPLAVPLPERIGAPSARYPWPFAGYRKLPGRTGCAVRPTLEQRDAAADPLARFLAALHAIPAAEATALGAQGDTIRRMDFAYRTPRARALLAELVEAGAVGERHARRLEGVIDRAPPEASGPPVLVHGDLYARHLLFDTSGRLSGAIDWGDVHVGDRAVDLAVAHAFFPARARAKLRRTYGEVDDVTWARAAFRAVHHTLMVTAYARGVGDANLLHEVTTAMPWIGEDG